MTLFLLLLSSSLLLCSLVAGFLFGFAVVAMPGLRALDDRPFLQAFQAMDRVIQDNRPLFMLVWVGSVAAVIATLGVGWGVLEGLDRALLVGAAVAYLAGVQLPTVAVNVPLNNAVQALDLVHLDDEAVRAARARFEPRWNRWNVARTCVAVGVGVGWIVLLARV